MQSSLWFCWLLHPVLTAFPEVSNLQTLPCSYEFHSYISPHLGGCSFSLQYVLPPIRAVHTLQIWLWVRRGSLTLLTWSRCDSETAFLLVPVLFLCCHSGFVLWGLIYRLPRFPVSVCNFSNLCSSSPVFFHLSLWGSIYFSSRVVLINLRRCRHFLEACFLQLGRYASWIGHDCLGCSVLLWWERFL